MTADAVAHVPDETATLPFCMVTALGSRTGELVPAELDRDRLVEWVDAQVEAPNLFYALRLDGFFDGVTTRCLPRQQRPFPPMSEVVKTQPTFSYDRVEGTMVGFRAPAYVGRISPPRYHLHFISRDHSFGGHVLGFKGCGAEIVFEQIDRHELQYPTTPDFTRKRLV